MSVRITAATLVALAAIWLLVLWMAPPESTGGVAFAQVQIQGKKVKSVQYVETRKDGANGPTTVTRFWILGPHLRRKEYRVVDGGRPKEGESFGVRVGENFVGIYDMKKGKQVVLFPDEKRFGVIQFEVSADPDGEGGTSFRKTFVKPHPETDYYAQIRNVPFEKAEKLGERTLDGKKAAGFRVVEKTGGEDGTADTWTRTYWVDPKTKLPIRIEISFQATTPGIGSSDFVLSDFIFDAPMDPSLFSTDPPEGYSVAK